MYVAVFREWCIPSFVSLVVCYVFVPLVRSFFRYSVMYFLRYFVSYFFISCYVFIDVCICLVRSLCLSFVLSSFY